MTRLGRKANELDEIRSVLSGAEPYVPIEDQLEEPMSPAEAMITSAEPRGLPAPLRAADQVVFPPWEPTGEETPKRTVEGVDLRFSPPPPETAGGAIPSSRTHINRFGPDEG